MTSKAAIANMALANIGSTQVIGDVDSDRSATAKAVRIFWDAHVGAVLRDFPWPFAKAYQTLALVDGSSTTRANYDWQYAYRYPSDCLFARRLVVEGVGRKDYTPPEFEVGRDSQGKLIFTDESPAELEYTMSVTDVEEWDASAVEMLSWLLSASLAPSQSRIKGMAEQAMRMYLTMKSIAEANALNERSKSNAATSELERSRD